MRRDVDLIKNSIECCAALREKVLVIKLPSLIIDKETLLESFAQNIKMLAACDAKIVIIHDYSSTIDKISALFGVSKKNYTSEIVNDNAQNIIEMVMHGYVGQKIVSKLCSYKIKAVGISGKDANLIVAKKQKKEYSDKKSIMHSSFLSEPLEITPDILIGNNELGFVTVISPIANDISGKATLLDPNLTAAMIATSLNASSIVYLGPKNFLTKNFVKITTSEEMDHVLLNKDINQENEKSLINAAYYIVENLENPVYFGDATKKDSLLLTIFRGKSINEIPSHTL